jgi:hypothetical protein
MLGAALSIATVYAGVTGAGGSVVPPLLEPLLDPLLVVVPLEPEPEAEVVPLDEPPLDEPVAPFEVEPDFVLPAPVPSLEPDPDVSVPPCEAPTVNTSGPPAEPQATTTNEPAASSATRGVRRYLDIMSSLSAKGLPSRIVGLRTKAHTVETSARRGTIAPDHHDFSGMERIVRAPASRPQWTAPVGRWSGSTRLWETRDPR